MAEQTETTFGGPAEDWTPPAHVETPAPPDVEPEPAAEPERQRGPDGRFLPAAEVAPKAAPEVAPEAPPEPGAAPESAKPDAAEQRWMQFIQLQQQQHTQQMQLLAHQMHQMRAPPPPPPEPEVKFEDLDPLDQIAVLHHNQRSLVQENVALKQTQLREEAYAAQIREEAYAADLARDMPAIAAKYPTLDRDDHEAILAQWKLADERRSPLQIAAEFAARQEEKGKRWAAAKGLSARPAPPAAVRSSLPTPTNDAGDKFAGIDFSDQTDDGWSNGWRQLQHKIHGPGR